MNAPRINLWRKALWHEDCTALAKSINSVISFINRRDKAVQTTLTYGGEAARAAAKAHAYFTHTPTVMSSPSVARRRRRASARNGRCSAD